MANQDIKFLELLASRILYQFEQRGLIKTQGATVDEVQANIKQGREIIVQMLINK